MLAALAALWPKLAFWALMLPIGIAAISGSDYDKQMMLITLLYGLSVLPVLIVPEVKHFK